MLVARIAGLVAPLCLAATVAVNATDAAQGAPGAVSLPALDLGQDEGRPITVAGRFTPSGGAHSAPRGSYRPSSPGGIGKFHPGGIGGGPKYHAPRVPRFQSRPPRHYPQPKKGQKGPPPFVKKLPITKGPAPFAKGPPPFAKKPPFTKGPAPLAKGPPPLPRVRLQATRKLPANLALMNPGLRHHSRYKPAGIEHHPDHKAAKSGWMHHHRPFFFRHDGHRWRRHYYTFLAGGLWYWFWYDDIADAGAAAADYPDIALPDCPPDSDDCVEPGMIAPALLEGRATEEDLDRCSAEFSSFNRATGTYVTPDGEEHICPYLE